jgi:hypothetical protein
VAEAPRMKKVKPLMSNSLLFILGVVGDVWVLMRNVSSGDHHHNTAMEALGEPRHCVCDGRCASRLAPAKLIESCQFFWAGLGGLLLLLECFVL